MTEHKKDITVVSIHTGKTLMVFVPNEDFFQMRFTRAMLSLTTFNIEIPIEIASLCECITRAFHYTIIFTRLSNTTLLKLVEIHQH
jgi:hypothetical protein